MSCFCSFIPDSSWSAILSKTSESSSTRVWTAFSYCRNMHGLLPSQKLILDKKDEWNLRSKRTSSLICFNTPSTSLVSSNSNTYGRCPLHCARFPRGSEAGIEQHGQGVRNAYCTIATSSDANGVCFTNRVSSIREFPCYLRFQRRRHWKSDFNRKPTAPSLSLKKLIIRIWAGTAGDSKNDFRHDELSILVPSSCSSSATPTSPQKPCHVANHSDKDSGCGNGGKEKLWAS